MEDRGLFPELMWQCLQIRPLVLAFRGPQVGSPGLHGAQDNSRVGGGLS